MNAKTDSQKGIQHEVSDYAKFDLPVLFYVLKGITSPENSLSATQLAIEMQSVLGEAYSGRTLKRRLDKLEEILNWKNEPDTRKRKEKKDIADIMYCVYGGQIKTTDAKTPRARGRSAAMQTNQKRYYFEPCLDDASMRLLNGTVTSSAFLTNEEKDYLLSRMRMLNMLDDFLPLPEEEENEQVFSQSPKKDPDVGFPGESNVFISNIASLNHAIQNDLQIEMTYGTYDIQDGCLDYHERTLNGKAHRYRINPYALCWSEGHYYLIATYVSGCKPPYVKEEGTPINFRVDRIIRIGRVPVKKGKSQNTIKYEKREKIPPRLRPFFRKNRDSVSVFDSAAYTARFPAMRISQQENLIDCEIECTSWSLQLLADTFGNLMEVRDTTKDHDKDDLDYNGREQTFIIAKIEQVEFENMRDFCLMHPEYIMPVSPPKLVNAVRDKLQTIINRYK